MEDNTLPHQSKSYFSGTGQNGDLETYLDKLSKFVADGLSSIYLSIQDNDNELDINRLLDKDIPNYLRNQTHFVGEHIVDDYNKLLESPMPDGFKWKEASLSHVNKYVRSGNQSVDVSGRVTTGQ